ncbi:MAG: putative membrane protein YdbT with pleckstrin-like domain [Chlamydiales bacterium]|jgi:uncharacterized membrane protein YdbT with pleckstrin-like domain
MNLKKDERILEIFQVHSYMNLALSIAIAFATTVFLYSSRLEYLFMSKILLAISVYLLIFSKLYHYNQLYLITTMKVCIQQGLVFGGKVEIPFGLIRDIVVSQSLLQRLFNAGNLCVVTEKNKYFMFRISDPYLAQELIQRQVFNKKSMGSIPKDVFPGLIER